MTYSRNLLFILFFFPMSFFMGCESGEEVDNSKEEAPEEEVPGEGEAETATQHLVVVTMDGVRWQEVFKGADPELINNPEYMSDSDTDLIKEKFWADTEEQRRKKLMPFLWNEFERVGKIYGNRDYGNKIDVTNESLKSLPGYAEIFNGYADPSIVGNKPVINNNVTVLEFINKQEGFGNGKVRITTAANIAEQLFHADRNEYSISGGHKDLTVFNKTIRALDNDKPRVVYAAFNKTDHWAHEYQYDTHLDLIHKFDSYVKEIWNHIQQNSFYRDKTTLLVTVDHGRGKNSEWHTHGSGGVAHAEEIWFAVAGPDTQASGEQEEEGQIYLNQFAKTIAALLGFNFDTGRAVGEPIESVMDKN